MWDRWIDHGVLGKTVLQTILVGR